MRTLTHKEWRDRGAELFGKDSRDWKFICLACGNIQSIREVCERMPNLDPKEVAGWIHSGCEGRINRKRGCNWTLNGLLHIHELEVAVNSDHLPAFPFVGDEGKIEPSYTPRHLPVAEGRPHDRVTS